MRWPLLVSPVVLLLLLLLGAEVEYRLFAVVVLTNLVPVCVTSVLLPQAECANVNGFVQCHHLVAGGWEGGNSQRVSLRPEAVAEWEQLNNFNKVLHVEGPPGTGKSTIAWAWACFKARDTNVVWVHRTAGGRSRISWLGAGYVVYFDVHAMFECLLALVLSACALLARATVVVVDGITNKRKDLFDDTAAWANASQHRQAVLVTSPKIVFPGQFDVDYGITIFPMPSLRSSSISRRVRTLLSSRL